MPNLEVSMGIALYFILFHPIHRIFHQPFLDFLGTLMTMDPPKCWSSNPRPISEARNPSDRTCMDSWQGTIELIRVLSVSDRMLFDILVYIGLYWIMMAYVGFYWVIGFYWFMLVSLILACMFDIIQEQEPPAPAKLKGDPGGPNSTLGLWAIGGTNGYHIFRLIQGIPSYHPTCWL